MIELMHGSLGGIRPTYPNSGPGIKTLQYGDEQLGYFGEVTGAELFTANEFINLTKAYFGARETAPDSMTQLWLKFFHKGKVIYIAKYPFIYAASWEDVYREGLLYGTQDNGKFPVSNAPTWQFNPLSKTEGGKEWTLVPRIMKGVNADPYYGLDNTTYTGSEYTELLGRVVDATNTPVVEKWTKFTFAALGLENSGGVRYSMLQETQASNSGYALYAGNGTTTGFFSRGAANKTTANLAYRPVLELLNAADMVIPAVDFTITSNGLPQITMAEFKQLPDSEITQRAEDLYVADFVSKEVLPTYSVDSGSAFRIDEISANDETNQWGSFTITGSYTA